MALLNNLSFETPGAAPGEALYWTVASTSGVESAAVLGASGEEEDFESGWNNDGYLLEHGAIPGAIFSEGVSVERFDWATTYHFDLSSVDALPVEDFESGWNNDGYLLALGATASAGVEGFETGWDNGTYYTALGATSSVQFDGAVSESVEDFEEVWADRRFEADASTDVLTTSAPHGFGNGDAVYLVAGAGALPAGLRAGYRYFARDVAANSLKVAAFSGGAAVDLRDAGVGEVYLRGDVTLYWPLEV